MSIFVDNYDPSDFSPRGVVNLMRGRGLASATDIKKRVCLLGRKSDGVPGDRVVRIQSLNEDEPGEDPKSAAGMFGEGSELYLMAKAAFGAFPGVELWALPIAEIGYLPSAASAPGAVNTACASATISVVGRARRPGEWIVGIHDKAIRVRVEKDATPFSTILSIRDALLEQLELPLDRAVLDSEDGLSYELEGKTVQYAEPTDGIPDEATKATLTIYAMHEGALGRTIDIFKRGGTPGQSLTVTPFSGGSAGAPASIQDDGVKQTLSKSGQFGYIVLANVDEATGLELRAFLEAESDAVVGRRQQAVMGWNADLDDLISRTEQVNSPRIQWVWSRGSSMTPGELAASVAAFRSGREGVFPPSNHSGAVIPGVPRPRLVGKLPSRNEVNLALHRGISPMTLDEKGVTLVRSVTTRHMDVYGSLSYVLLDTNKVTTSDFIADDLAMKILDRYRSYKLARDSDVAAPPNTITPSVVKRDIARWMREYAIRGFIKDVDKNISMIRTELGESDGRLNFEVPEAVVDICAVTAGNLIRY